MIFAVAAVLSFMTAVPLRAQAPAEPAPAADAEPGAAFVANYDPSKSYSRLLFPNVAAMVGLTPAQQEEVTRLMTERSAALAAATDQNQWPEIVQKSEEQLKALLNPEQLKNFDQAINDKLITIRFSKEPWANVLKWFAAELGLQLVMNAPPPGTFNYNDKNSYTPKEALDILNGRLQFQGYTLLRTGNMLYVHNFKDGPIPMQFLPKVAVEELPQQSRFSYVALTLPLGQRPLAKVLAAIKPFQGPYNSTQALTGNALLIVDSVNSFQANYANAGANLFEVIPAMRRFCKQRKERELSDRSFKAAMGFSTISATDILHAITEAYLADLEDAAETKYQLITKEVSLSDFNAVDTYLPTLQGRLKKISETGQIEHVSYTTEKISAKTEPLGVTFAIPEMVLINDRLEVFVDLLQQFRDLPGECLEHDVAEYLWKMVDGDIPAADGQAFFSAARGNYFTGAGTALSEAGLSAAVNSTQGAFIVTGSNMEATALRLYASENLNVVDTIGEKNIYQGKYKPYKWEYLNAEYARAKKDDGTTDSFFQTYADTAWFMFRDPTRRPIMTVNKLSGYETPQIRQYDADPSVWGTVYQLIFPYSISAAWTNGAIVMRGS